MKWFIFFIFVIISLVLESTLTTIPLVFIVLFSATILFESTTLLLLGFVCGLLLDTLTFHPIGESSLFFLLILTIAFLYGRKFEIKSLLFVGIISLIGSFLYLWIFGGMYIFPESIIAAIMGIGLFSLFQSYVTHFDLKP